MGRYGVNDGKDECDSTTAPRHSGFHNIRSNYEQDQDGTDDVDGNVQSKMLNPATLERISPLSKANINNSTRSPRNVESEDRDVLSTSLPSTLPSYSNYSLNSSYEDALFRRSLSHHRSNLTSDEGTSESENVVPPHSRSLSTSTTSRQNDIGREESHKGFLPVLVVVFAIVACYMYSTLNVIKSNIYTEVNFEHDLYELGKKFLKKDDSILKLQMGIKTISQNEDTGSFIFVYNSESSSHNEYKFNKFVDGVAQLSAKYLRNQSTEVHPVLIDKFDPVLYSHGELVGHYRSDVETQGVLIVRRLQEVPTHLAMAFHYYCDEHSPLVKKSAIFFTFDMKNCHSDNSQTIHSIIEKCLTNVWKTLPTYNLIPLLTRVVNVVIAVDLF